MNRKRFTPQQIAAVLLEHGNGKSDAQIIAEHGMSQSTLDKWRKRYHSLTATEIDRLKQLEEENRRLKARCKELTMDLEAAKQVIEKKI